MPGCLYVVATPIGNLGDVTRRAANVLATVETIASEDTRRTAALLAHLNIRRPRLVSLRDDNEPRAAARVLERLEAGEEVALVSDAGTPLISDPGFRLVSLCRERGVAVLPVPGPSAVTAALSVCPLPLDGYRFVGFLDAGPAARASANWKRSAQGGRRPFSSRPRIALRPRWKPSPAWRRKGCSWSPGK